MIAMFLIFGCGDGSGQQDTTQTASDLESKYLAVTDDMRTTVSTFSKSSNPSKSVGDYYSHMNTDIGQLSDYWNQMQTRCSQFSECPSNGGATGNLSNQCMWGGHMMDQNRMGQLHDFINSCRSSLDEFWTACGQQWDSATCQQIMRDHTRQMFSTLDQMWNDCNDWWSNGGVMGGDGDMMYSDHWGDCCENTNGTGNQWRGCGDMMGDGDSWGGNMMGDGDNWGSWH